MSLLRFTNARGETIDMRSSTIVASQLDGFSAPSVRTELQDVVARPGAGYVTRRVDPRLLTVQLGLVGDGVSTLYDVRREVARKLSPSLGLGVLEYQPPGETIIYAIDCTVRRLGGPYQRPYYGEAVVQFEAPFPYFRDTIQKSDTIVLSGSNTTDVITVGGDVPTWPIVTFSSNGTAQNPRWDNQTTGHFTSFGSRTSPMSLDDVLVVDHFTYSAVLNGVTNWIDRLTSGSSFWSLQEGDNTIFVSAGGIATTKTFLFEWYDLYEGA